MSRVSWSVGKFRGRTGVIRIVDASSGPWGHINVDHFLFEGWEVAMGEATTYDPDPKGAQMSGRASSDAFRDQASGSPSARFRVHRGNDQLVHRSLALSSPDAGAAYVFRRREASGALGLGGVAPEGAEGEFCLPGWDKEVRRPSASEKILQPAEPFSCI